MSERVERPRQVTTLVAMIIIGSVFTVLSGFDRVSNLRSLDTRRSVEQFLADPPGSGLGIGLEQALSLLRVTSMVAVACAGALAVLSIWLLRGDRQSRLAATVLAVPLFLTGLAVGGLLSAVVSAAIVMLWASPARHFYDGTPMPEPVRRPERADRQEAPAEQPPTPWGAPGPVPPHSTWGPAPGAQQTIAEAPPSPARPAPAARPSVVTWAVLLTWMSTGLVTMSALASLPVILRTDPDELLAEVQKQNPDLAQEAVPGGLLLASLLVVVGVLVVWAVAAAVVAWFVLRGREWARITLIVSAALVAVLSLAMAVVQVGMVVLALTGGLAAAWLLRPEAAAWCRRGRMDA